MALRGIQEYIAHRCQPSRFDRESPGAGVPLPVGKILPVTSRYSPDPVQKYFKPHFLVTASLSDTQQVCMKHSCWGCSVCGRYMMVEVMYLGIYPSYHTHTSSWDILLMVVRVILALVVWKWM